MQSNIPAVSWDIRRFVQITVHWSTTILKPLTAEMSNMDHLTILQCSVGKSWILAIVWLPTDTNHLPEHYCKSSTHPCLQQTPMTLVSHQAATPKKSCMEQHEKNVTQSFKSQNAPDLASSLDLALRFPRAKVIMLHVPVHSCHWGVLLPWGFALSKKKCLGGFPFSKNIHMNTRTKSFPREHCTAS